jgi:hypothetical protein
LGGNFYMLKIASSAAISIGIGTGRSNTIRRSGNHLDHIPAIKGRSNAGNGNINNFSGQAVSKKNHSAFMAGYEVSPVGNLFDCHPNDLPHSENGAWSRCHKAKPKGVSYVICT